MAINDCKTRGDLAAFMLTLAAAHAKNAQVSASLQDSDPVGSTINAAASRAAGAFGQSVAEMLHDETMAAGEIWSYVADHATAHLLNVGFADGLVKILLGQRTATEIGNVARCASAALIRLGEIEAAGQ